MSGTVWLLFGLLVVVFFAWRMLLPGFGKVIRESIDASDISPLVGAITKKPMSARPAAFNHAIRRMWDSFQRPLAVELIKVLAKDHGDSAITQYWIRQVLQVEPQMAKKSFSKDFLDTYYQPEVAARCGPVG